MGSDKYIVTLEELNELKSTIASFRGTSSNLSWPDGYVSAINEIVAADHSNGIIEQASRSVSNRNRNYKNPQDFQEFEFVPFLGDATAFSSTTLLNLNFSNAKYIVPCAFLNRRDVSSFSGSNVTNIGDSAFASCYSLTTLSLPAATTIGGDAFAKCYSLTTVSLPAASYIGTSAFRDCTSLTTVNFPAATTIVSYAFYSCTNLTTVNFPAATTIGSYAFAGCTSLTTVSLPAAVTIRTGAFRSCTSLPTVNLPVATTIGDYAFSSCTSLTTVSLPAATTISNSAFYNCPNLTKLILLNSEVTKISYAPSGSFSIYVPSGLYGAYSKETYWTTIKSRIHSAYQYVLNTVLSNGIVAELVKYTNDPDNLYINEIEGTVIKYDVDDIVVLSNSTIGINVTLLDGTTDILVPGDSVYVSMIDDSYNIYHYETGDLVNTYSFAFRFDICSFNSDANSPVIDLKFTTLV